MVMDNLRLVVPEECRPGILKALPVPHVGITKTPEMAKESNYWVEMSKLWYKSRQLEILVQPGFWFTVLAGGRDHSVTYHCNIFQAHTGPCSHSRLQ